MTVHFANDLTPRSSERLVRGTRGRSLNSWSPRLAGGRESGFLHVAWVVLCLVPVFLGCRAPERDASESSELGWLQGTWAANEPAGISATGPDRERHDPVVLRYLDSLQIKYTFELDGTGSLSVCAIGYEKVLDTTWQLINEGVKRFVEVHSVSGRRLDKLECIGTPRDRITLRRAEDPEFYFSKVQKTAGSH